MDLLYQRYASPFSFIDGMILTGRFGEFVENFVQTINEEKEEKNTWDFWLHRVWEGSFAEFKERLRIDNENQNMSKGTIETTVQDSLNILKNFNPQNEGGE